MQKESRLYSKFKTGGSNPIQQPIATLLMQCEQYHQKGDLQAAERCCRAILQQNGNQPQTHLYLGKLLVAQGKMNQAIDHYLQALQLEPHAASAYIDIGDALLAIGHRPASISSYRQAIRLDPANVTALNNLGIALRADDQIDRAVSALQQAIKLRPHRAECHNNLANAFKDQLNLDKALHHYRQAIRLRPDFAEAHFNCALVHLMKADFADGWREYEWRLQRPEWKNICPGRINLPPWKGESFEGQRLLIYDEQGFGDTLQFGRYLPLVKALGGHLIFETRSELIGLFENCPAVDDLVARSSYETPAKAADMYIPLLSLPAVFQTRLNTIPAGVPYLQAATDKISRWQEFFAEDLFNIGLIWAGSQTDPKRSLRLKMLRPLKNISNIRLFGVQKDLPPEDIEACRQLDIINLEDDLADFTDTAAVIHHLDLIVSIDTAAAHLAGAMGKPVWLLLPYVADWRWLLDRVDSPWYPSMRLFRQTSRGNWSEVVEEVHMALQQWVENKLRDCVASPADSIAESCYDEGNCYYDGRQWHRAIAAYQRAVDHKPDFIEAYFNLATTYQEKKDFSEAAATYQKVLELKPDAVEALFNLGCVHHTQGRFEAAIQTYRRALALKPNFAEAYNNCGAALMEVGDPEGARDCFQHAVGQRNDYAQAHYNLGRTYSAQHQFESAVASFQTAVQLNPDYPAAWHDMGLCWQALRDLAAAERAFKKAIALKPDYLSAYYNLGNLYSQCGQMEETLNWYDKALQLQPHDAEALHNFGRMLKHQDRLTEAESYYRQALARQPDHVEAHFDRAIALLAMGQLKDGWQEYEWRFKRSNWQNAYPYRFNQPRWDGSSSDGKKLLVHCEQGLGDTLQFSRYLPLVKQRGAWVIFEVQQPLFDLFKGSDGIDELRVLSVENPTPCNFDMHIPLLSLPLIFETTVENIPSDTPYINADPHKRRAWSQRFADSRLKVGVVWAGGALHPYNQARCCRLEDFLPLAHIPGVKLYGLQKGSAADQAARDDPAADFINWGRQLNDFSDTSALIDNLDLVISVDTAVAHLAGAMGKPVWVLLPRNADWRWLRNRNDSPWYPTMKLFRQPQPDDWQAVFEQVKDALLKWNHAKIR